MPIPRRNGSCRRYRRPVATLPWIAPAALKPHLDSVLGGQADYLPLSLEQAIFLRDGNQDRYFLPRVLRIRSDSGELLGAAVVLSDVTKFHLLDQLKSDMISTVSHELKTPLTSLQMVVYLLLEEAVGPLSTKQTELLLQRGRTLTDCWESSTICSISPGSNKAGWLLISSRPTRPNGQGCARGTDLPPRIPGSPYRVGSRRPCP